jgi:hypothetical protein
VKPATADELKKADDALQRADRQRLKRCRVPVLKELCTSKYEIAVGSGRVKKDRLIDLLLVSIPVE